MADDGSFTVLGENDKPFSPTSQSAIDLLEGIMPSDKAQSVPHVLIWEIDPTTGKALREEDGFPKAPLSIQVVSPPKFGASIDDKEFRFRERPPVSMERVSIKTKNPRGILSYEELELVFTVHRPDVIFENIDQDDHDVWASLIVPGRAHALEYGWSASTGVKNGILNGEGIDDGTNVIPGRRQVRFTVVTYNFTILPDNSVRFMITGIEIGEFNLRQAFLIKPKDKEPSGGSPSETQERKAAARIKNDTDPYAEDRQELDALLKKLQDRVGDKETASSKQNAGDKMVKFGKLLEIIFVPRLRDALKEMGFEVNDVRVGLFNKRAGTPAKKYGAQDMGGKAISDFEFPLQEIAQVFTDLMSQGERLTVMNFLQPFLRLFEDPTRWDRSDEPDPTKRTLPQVVVRTVFRKLNNGKLEVTVFLFDATREYVRFTPDESKKLKPGAYTKADVRQAVLDADVPYISLVRANSFVKEPNFQVVQDEQMKSIFMRRYLTQSRNRDQLTTQPDVAAKQSTPPPDPRQLFSASIQGELTILGNFVFDVFQLVWLDFGVPQWDGPFNIAEREDVIEAGEFTTKLKIYSTGQDPLGTQRKPSG